MDSKLDTYDEHAIYGTRVWSLLGHLHPSIISLSLINNTGARGVTYKIVEDIRVNRTITRTAFDQLFANNFQGFP